MADDEVEPLALVLPVRTESPGFGPVEADSDRITLRRPVPDRVFLSDEGVATSIRGCATAVATVATVTVTLTTGESAGEPTGSQQFQYPTPRLVRRFAFVRHDY
jgi:hypothetical protein